MVLLEFSMFPTTVGESKSAYVARIIDIIDRSGITKLDVTFMQKPVRPLELLAALRASIDRNRI